METELKESFTNYIEVVWRCGEYFVSTDGKFYLGDRFSFRYLPNEEVPRYVLIAAIGEIVNSIHKLQISVGRLEYNDDHS